MLKHWPPRVANWLPKLFFSQTWGEYKGHKVQHFWGQIEKILSPISRGKVNRYLPR